MENGYFEGLIRDYLLDNPHEAVLTVSPSPGQTAREEAALAARLADHKAGLTTDDNEKLAAATRSVTALQEDPSRPEDV